MGDRVYARGSVTVPPRIDGALMARAMHVNDYNGDGKWAGQAIIDRYNRYSRDRKVESPRTLELRTSHEGDFTWIWPVIDQVVDGIEGNDLACAAIGVEFIEEDQGFAFGAILKHKCARALRRFKGLPTDLVVRIRRRVVGMLATGFVPREYIEYAKLLRAVGIGPHWAEIEAAVPKNRLARRMKAYFLDHCRGRDDSGA